MTLLENMSGLHAYLVLRDIWTLLPFILSGVNSAGLDLLVFFYGESVITHTIHLPVIIN